MTFSLASLGAVTAGGFLASAHCIGMCGGFAVALGASQRGWLSSLPRQLIYNLGRVFTYAFLGMVAGYAGSSVSRVSIGPLTPASIFGLVAGGSMILLGLVMLGALPLPHRWAALGCDAIAPLFRYFLEGRGWWGYFAAGLANGFLPCGLVYSFLALAIAAAEPLHGGAIMIAFGLGTFPAMLLAGLGGRLLSVGARRGLVRGAAAFVVLLGGVTMWRAWPSQKACCDHSVTGQS